MENTELMMNPQSAEMLEKVVVDGDLSKLTSAQRLDYYRQVCQSCGLNPLTKPFDYLRLNGKLTLYARKDATDQLRKIHGVSVDDVTREFMDDLIIATAKGHDATGRTDFEIGVVSKKDMQGNLGNALMKAVTKAKRRLTLSLCGLGWLDETETETIPDARPVIVDDNGNIMGEIEARIEQKPAQSPKPSNNTLSTQNPVETPENAFDEVGFLRQWKHRVKVDGTDVPLIRCDLATASETTTSKGKPFAKCTVQEFSYMWNAYTKRFKNPANSDEVRDDALMKLSAINEILTAKASRQAELDEIPDPHINKGEE